MIERLTLYLQDLLDTVIDSRERKCSWVKDDQLAFETAMLTANIAVAEMGKRFVRYKNKIMVIDEEV